MKENIGDKIVDRLHERRMRVQTSLARQYKSTKPFRMEPVPDEYHINVYNNLTQEDLNYAIQTYGREAVNEWMFMVNGAMRKRGVM